MFSSKISSLVPWRSGVSVQVCIYYLAPFLLLPHTVYLLLTTDDLYQTNPKLIYTRVSGYGQTGPYTSRPGYASVCEVSSSFLMFFFARSPTRFHDRFHLGHGRI